MYQVVEDEDMNDQLKHMISDVGEDSFKRTHAYDTLDNYKKKLYFLSEGKKLYFR